MSAETIQPDGATVVRLADRRPTMPADTSVGTVRLGSEQTGAVVEKLPDATFRAPAWRRYAANGWGVVKTTGLGAAPLRQAWRYQRATTFADQIREVETLLSITSAPEVRKALHAEIGGLEAARKETARSRHREPESIAKGAAGGMFVLALIVVAFVVTPLVPAGVAAVGAGGAYLAGRKEQKRRAEATVRAINATPQHAELEPGGPSKEEVEAAVTAAQEAGVYSPAMLPRGAKPYPIDRVTTEAEAADCILRALVKEGVPVGDVSEVQRADWGWQAIVRVTEGTPAAIIKVAEDLETLFDVAQGSVRVQPLVERRARALFRIVLSDPFASAPAPEYRAPRSLSIRDRARIGSSIDGEPLLVTLAGVMGEIIAASGGGKTGILQALGEVTTACRDTITIDLDPAGDGLEDLGPAARLQGRTHEQIEAVLLFLLMLAKARARLRKKLGMGRKWVASPEHPAIVTFIDEYPKLSKLGKRLAFELLLVGRKEEMPVEIASQGGTKVYLGENIAQMLALRLVGPCKRADTDAVFGDGSAAEGYLPHRLSPATATDPRDAGHIYGQGIPGTLDAPIEYKIHEHPQGQLAKLAEERRDAGLLDPEVDSLTAMASVDLPDYVLPEYDAEGNLKKEAPVELLTWEQLLRLCEADPPAEGVTPESPARRTVRHVVEAMEEEALDKARVETMLGLIQQRHPDMYEALTADDLGKLLRDTGCGSTVSIGAVDGRKNASGYRLEALQAAL